MTPNIFKNSPDVLLNRTQDSKTDHGGMRIRDQQCEKCPFLFRAMV